MRPVWVGCALVVAACQDTTNTPSPQTAPPPPQGALPYANPYYGQPASYPPPQSTSYGPAPASSPPAAPPAAPLPPQAAPWPAPPVPAATRPLLGPLIGALAWQAESRLVVKELIANLAPQSRSRVATIPLIFDQNPNEINAFAGCDDSGAPFVAGTEGLLEAIDAISQTKATDELYGTQTYEAYIAAVAPRLVSKDGGSAMLPAGVIPGQYWIDGRRVSRAHEVFDEIVGFTFGHELSHHYLGHTGCANGQAGTIGPAIAQLGVLATSILPAVNQPNEAAADVNGCLNVLDTGRARAPGSYRWTEQGGLSLLDFFARLDRASGASPLLGFLRTHPNPGLRIPLVQAAAGTWRLQHAG